MSHHLAIYSIPSGRRTSASVAGAWLLMLSAFWGCEASTPPKIDLAKTPWLDPNVQSQGLNDGDERIRAFSAYNLGAIGAPSAAAIPDLEKLAQDDANPKVREQAAKAVEKIRAALYDE